MAQKHIDMTQARQIQQLSTDGVPIKEIVRSTGISRKTVRKYLRKIKANDQHLQVNVSPALPDNKLAAVIYNNDLSPVLQQRFEALLKHFNDKQDNLHKTGVTKQLLWIEYVTQYPLIPDIVVAESGLPLQTKIKNLAIGFGRESINEDLVKNQGMADDSTTTVKPQATVKKELEPMITYVTDRANILSIKPLLLFDLAQLHQLGLQNKTWTAVGAGIQLSVVIARLETGYMHTISPKSDSKKGNFFLRFVFQNFF